MSVYSAAVQTDSPYVYYPDASSAPWVDDVGALDVAMIGATADVPGPLVLGDTRAFSFDGVDDWGQVALDLSDTSVLSFELWLWWDAFGTSFDLALEHTAAWFSNVGGFSFNPDMDDSTLAISHLGDVGQNEKRYNRPSAAAWHHYVGVLDFTQPGTDEITGYLDGALWTPLGATQTSNNSSGTTFANSNLNLMSRNGASLFGAGDMAHLAIYKSSLPAVRVAAHYQAGILASAEQTAIWPYNRQGPF